MVNERAVDCGEGVSSAGRFYSTFNQTETLYMTGANTLVRVIWSVNQFSSSTQSRGYMSGYPDPD